MPTEIKDKVKSFFRKNYKTKNVSQMATELSGKQKGNPLNTNVKSLITRFKDFLIEKNIIKKKDLVKGYGGLNLENHTTKSFFYV